MQTATQVFNKQKCLSRPPHHLSITLKGLPDCDVYAEPLHQL